ncbi:MAG: HSP90 family protein [Demequinaceae bacterium]|nr:HSP90 family protein [Demequinaceae bacterium]
MGSFGVDLGGVIGLLSRHIYSGPEVFARELIQNSRDALIARADHGPVDPAWSIRITPADAGDGTFRIEDDGIGLSSAEVVEFLSTVGGSSKRDLFELRNQDFLGHFGIGLLSCFMVADTITILSHKRGHPPVRWEGVASGSFTVEELPDEGQPIGTTVMLRPAPDERDLLGRKSVARLVRRYAEFLPVPLYVTQPDGSRDLATGPAPFLAHTATDRARVMEYGESIIGHVPLDAIALEVPDTATRGVAYVLGHPTSGLDRMGARVYLGRMLLAEDERNIVPSWAFFLRPVITSDALTPTASRESLVHDDAVRVTAAAVGEAVRDWVRALADRNPVALHRFLSIHDLAIRAACLEDDEFFRIVGPHLTFETAAGTKTLQDIVEANAILTFAEGLDEFRMLTALGSDPALINASYVHHAELLRAVPVLFDGVEARESDLTGALAALAEPSLADRARTIPLADRATAALERVDVETIIKVLPDPTTPALYVADAEVLARVDMKRAAEIAAGPWASALGKAGARVDEVRARQGRTSTRAQVCLNWASPLVQRLAELDDVAVFERSVRLLYVQALLAGRRPLTAADRTIMSESLDDLITLSVGIDTGGATHD